MTDLTIITAASSNHFQCLRNLLMTLMAFEPKSRVIVYDLGLKASELDQLRIRNSIVLRRFAFESYPSWVRLKDVPEKGKRSGFYAWKPIIVHDVFQEFGNLVLW